MSRRKEGTDAAVVGSPQVATWLLTDDGTFPNNPDLPLIVYGGAFNLPWADAAGAIEQQFQAHHWPAAWRFGVFDFHHYHSTAHEALGVFAGWARLLFGGPEGVTIQAQPGDAIVVPAGVAHKCLESRGLRVVGAYPRGQDFDMQRGEPGERPAADRRIAAVPLPEADPVLGTSGPLHREWAVRADGHQGPRGQGSGTPG